MKEYQPNQQIVERAAELWVRMLRRPKYDNGDNSDAGFFAQVLVRQIRSNVTEEKLEAFRASLINRLMKPNERGYYETVLCVDYSPGGALADAAEEVGLKMEFPWKTDMYLSDRHLSLSAGHCAETKCHYPLSDGRWLITTLSGSEITKVIEYVEGGKPEFEIESQVLATIDSEAKGER